MFKAINGGQLPTIGSKYSACVDVYVNEDVTIGAGETKLVGLGIAIDEDFIKHKIATSLGFEKWFGGNSERAKHLKFRINDFLSSHYLLLEPRSSLRSKGLIAETGIIDIDYKDEIKIILHNPIKTSEILNYIRFAQGLGEESQIETEYEIKKGDRIAQIALMEHKSYLFGIESDAERTGGFGRVMKKKISFTPVTI